MGSSSFPRRAVLTFGVGLTVLVASACAAPTLPLPPPSTPTVETVGTDRYLLASVRGAEAHAIIVIYNNDPSVPPSDRVDAAEADVEGSWQKVVTAKPGTILDVWQESGTTRSPPITIQLPR